MGFLAMDCWSTSSKNEINLGVSYNVNIVSVKDRSLEYVYILVSLLKFSILVSALYSFGNQEEWYGQKVFFFFLFGCSNFFWRYEPKMVTIVSAAIL